MLWSNNKDRMDLKEDNSKIVSLNNSLSSNNLSSNNLNNNHKEMGTAMAMAEDMANMDKEVPYSIYNEGPNAGPFILVTLFILLNGIVGNASVLKLFQIFSKKINCLLPCKFCGNIVIT